VTAKDFSGKGLKTPRGSLRSLRVPSPVLVTVVVTFKFSNPLTLTLGVEALRVKPGAADTVTTKAARARMKARREGGNIAREVMNVVGGIEERTSLRV